MHKTPMRLSVGGGLTGWSAESTVERFVAVAGLQSHPSNGSFIRIAAEHAKVLRVREGLVAFVMG